MPSTLTSRNSTINSVRTGGGVQQPSASLSSGRFASNNLPVALSQVTHLYFNILRVIPEILSIFNSSVCHFVSAVV